MKTRGYWADLSRPDFLRLDAKATIAVLPIGAIEQHGPHLPVSVDSDLTDATLRRCLPLLDPSLSVLIMPTISVGKSMEHVNHPGTISLSSDTFTRVVMEYGASVARAGIRKLVLCNGHGGNRAPLGNVLRDLRIEHGLITVLCSWSSFYDASELVGDDEYRHGIHGGDHETSAMLACRGDRVDMSRAENFRTVTDSWRQDFDFLDINGPAQVGWIIDDLCDSGASGNAAAATREKGEAILDNSARGMARFLAEFDRFEMLPPHDDGHV